MEDIRPLLEKVFADVLEKFAFMFSESVTPSDFFMDAPPFYRATISFSGPRQGTLSIAASGKFCNLLSTNILGEEEGSAPEAQACDSLKELLNVTCGEFLEKLSGPQVIYNLSVPDAVSWTQNQMQALADSDKAILLLVDNAPIILQGEIKK